MANIKYIDLVYMKEFWAYVKTLPSNAKLTVTGDGTTDASRRTLLGHLSTLYSKATSGVKSVTKSNGSYEGLTVSDKDANGKVTIGLDLSSFKADEINSIITALVEDTANTGIVITKNLDPNNAEKYTSVTIGLNSALKAKIDNALTSVNTYGYITGNGTSTNPINIDTTQVKGTGELATKGYVDEQIQANAGVTSVVGTEGEIDVTPTNGKGGVIISLSDTIKDNIDGKVNKSDLTASGYLVDKDNTDDIFNLDIDSEKIASASPSHTPATGDDKLATKGYVDSVVKGKNGTVTVATGASNPTQANTVTFTNVNNGTDYYINLKSNDGSVYNVKLDASDFVKDSFLKSVEVGTGDDANKLVFTWNTIIDGDNPADQSQTKTITKVDLTKYIDIYEQGDGISITGKVIAAKVTANGYLQSTDSGLKLINIVNGGDTTKTNLATEGYVESKVADITTYTAGDGVNISTTSNTSTISVEPKTNGGVTVDANGVSVNTTGYITKDNSGNVVVDTAQVTLVSDASNTSSTKLTTQGYVDTKLESLSSGMTTYTDGNGVVFGTKTNNQVPVNVATNGYVTINNDAIELTNIKYGSGSYATSVNLSTKGYVDEKIGELDTHIVEEFSASDYLY